MIRKHFLLALLLAGTASPALAQHTINTLASFNGANGDGPLAGLTLSGSTLYGTTQGGGLAFTGGPINSFPGGPPVSGYGDGVVFSLPMTGGTPTVLGQFNNSNGANPDSGLILSGTTLYGATAGSQAPLGLDGKVFSVPVSGGTPTVLASFNAASPQGRLTLSGGTLYGVAGGPGYANGGVVFSVPVTGGSPFVLASFVGGANGTSPDGGLIPSGTAFYGTTLYGGASSGPTFAGYGAVFSVPKTGGTPTVLGSFNGANGAFPTGVILSGTALYGMTSNGGAYGGGVVFSLPLTGGTPTVLASLDGNQGAGQYENGLTVSDGILYGTTLGGGDNSSGEVFSVPVTGGMPTVLASFIGGNGLYPYGDLIISDGTLYGTTYSGGADGYGTVFSIAVPEPGSMSVLAIAGLALLRRRVRRSDTGSATSKN